MKRTLLLISLGLVGYIGTQIIIPEQRKVELYPPVESLFETNEVTPMDEWITSVPSDHAPRFPQIDVGGWLRNLTSRWGRTPTTITTQPEPPKELNTDKDVEPPVISTIGSPVATDPCEQWRSLYPNLAKQLKPGQSCYR